MQVGRPETEIKKKPQSRIPSEKNILSAYKVTDFSLKRRGRVWVHFHMSRLFSHQLTYYIGTALLVRDM